MEGQGSSAWTPDYKVRGGNALVYDSMMQVRIQFAGQVRDYSAEGSPVVGKRHRVKILKNKHGKPFGQTVFYSATGEGLCPIGFDTVREVLHEAVDRGIVAGPNDPGKMTAGTKFEWEGEAFDLKSCYVTEEGADRIVRLVAALNAELFAGK
jgi:hypothetical protein